MSKRDKYQPGPAAGAAVHKEGENWTLVLTRELRHPPAKVWQALTEPEQLREWAPFDADKSLGSTGTVKLMTVSADAASLGNCREAG
jgi:chitodextrinase